MSCEGWLSQIPDVEFAAIVRALDQPRGYDSPEVRAENSRDKVALFIRQITSEWERLRG